MSRARNRPGSQSTIIQPGTSNGWLAPRGGWSPGRLDLVRKCRRISVSGQQTAKKERGRAKYWPPPAAYQDALLSGSGRFAACGWCGRRRLLRIRYPVGSPCLLAASTMTRNAPFAPRVPRLFARPLVGRALLMRRLAPLAGDLPLLASIHRRESAIFLRHGFLPLPSSSPDELVRAYRLRCATEVPERQCWREDIHP